MKKLPVLLILLLTIIACSQEEDAMPSITPENFINMASEEVPPGTISGIDTDGDLIPDDIEIEKGTSQFVANIPTLAIQKSGLIKITNMFKRADQTKEIVIKDNLYVDNKRSTSILRKYLLNMYINKILNRPYVLPSEALIKFMQITNWTNSNYFRFKDQISLLENLGFKENPKDASIDISLKLSKDSNNLSHYTFSLHLINKEEGNSIQLSRFEKQVLINNNIFNISLSNKKSIPITPWLSKKSELAISIDDFVLEIDKKKIQYSKLIDSIDSKCTKLIISTKNQDQEIYIAKGRKISNILKLIDQSTELDGRGNLIHFKGRQSYKLSNTNDINAGTWQIFISNNKTTHDTLDEHDVVYIAYLTKPELLDQRGKEIQLIESTELKNQLDINTIQKGALVKLEITPLATTNMILPPIYKEEIPNLCLPYGHNQARVSCDKLFCEAIYQPTYIKKTSELNLSNDLSNFSIKYSMDGKINDLKSVNDLTIIKREGIIEKIIIIIKQKSSGPFELINYSRENASNKKIGFISIDNECSDQSNFSKEYEEITVAPVDKYRVKVITRNQKLNLP